MRGLSAFVIGGASAALTGCGGDSAVAVSDAVAATSAATSATPSAGPGKLVRTELARAVVQVQGGGSAEFKPGTDTVVLKIVLEPGGSTGWHAHSDGGMFMIQKGAISSYGLDGPPCKATEFKAGSALFVPPHAKYQHLVRNEGTETAEATVYYFNVPTGQPTGHPAAAPKTCPADLK